MSLILSILGFAALLIAGVLLALAAFSSLGVIVAGSALERLFDLVVPARKSGLGADGIVGELAVVVVDFVPVESGGDSEGTVRVSGELWKARFVGTDVPIRTQRVRVDSTEGLVAVVVRPDGIPS
ncbi:MAG: hypothetical protein ACI9QQ_002865 [Myxococcota bacterium]|jgi:membrane protein implicated in regulation of membrane protease activity